MEATTSKASRETDWTEEKGQEIRQLYHRLSTPGPDVSSTMKEFMAEQAKSLLKLIQVYEPDIPVIQATASGNPEPLPTTNYEEEEKEDEAITLAIARASNIIRGTKPNDADKWTKHDAEEVRATLKDLQDLKDKATPTTKTRMLRLESTLDMYLREYEASSPDASEDEANHKARLLIQKAINFINSPPQMEATEDFRQQWTLEATREAVSILKGISRPLPGTSASLKAIMKGHHATLSQLIQFYGLEHLQSAGTPTTKAPVPTQRGPPPTALKPVYIRADHIISKADSFLDFWLKSPERITLRWGAWDACYARSLVEELAKLENDTSPQQRAIIRARAEATKRLMQLYESSTTDHLRSTEKFINLYTKATHIHAPGKPDYRACYVDESKASYTIKLASIFLAYLPNAMFKTFESYWSAYHRQQAKALRDELERLSKPNRSVPHHLRELLGEVAEDVQRVIISHANDPETKEQWQTQHYTEAASYREPAGQHLSLEALLSLQSEADSFIRLAEIAESEARHHRWSDQTTETALNILHKISVLYPKAAAAHRKTFVEHAQTLGEQINRLAPPLPFAEIFQPATLRIMAFFSVQPQPPPEQTDEELAASPFITLPIPSSLQTVGVAEELVIRIGQAMANLPELPPRSKYQPCDIYGLHQQQECNYKGLIYSTYMPLAEKRKSLNWQACQGGQIYLSERGNRVMHAVNSIHYALQKKKAPRTLSAVRKEVATLPTVPVSNSSVTGSYVSDASDYLMLPLPPTSRTKPIWVPTIATDGLPRPICIVPDGSRCVKSDTRHQKCWTPCRREDPQHEQCWKRKSASCFGFATSYTRDNPPTCFFDHEHPSNKMYSTAGKASLDALWLEYDKACRKGGPQFLGESNEEYKQRIRRHNHSDHANCTGCHRCMSANGMPVFSPCTCNDCTIQNTFLNSIGVERGPEAGSTNPNYRSAAPVADMQLRYAKINPDMQKKLFGLMLSMIMLVTNTVPCDAFKINPSLSGRVNHDALVTKNPYTIGIKLGSVYINPSVTEVFREIDGTLWYDSLNSMSEHHRPRGLSLREVRRQVGQEPPRQQGVQADIHQRGGREQGGQRAVLQGQWHDLAGDPHHGRPQGLGGGDAEKQDSRDTRGHHLAGDHPCQQRRLRQARHPQL